MLIGSGLMRSRTAASSARTKRMPSPASFGLSAISNRTATRGSIVEWTRCPNPGRRLFARLRLVAPSARRRHRTTAPRGALARSPRRSAPCSPTRRRRARRRWRARRPRWRPRATAGCPTPPAARSRRTARRRRDPRRRSGWRPAAGAPPATAADRGAAGRSVGERRALHQLEDVVSADPDVVRAGVDDGGAPGIHSSDWMLRPCRVPACKVTVTSP